MYLLHKIIYAGIKISIEGENFSLSGKNMGFTIYSLNYRYDIGEVKYSLWEVYSPGLIEKSIRSENFRKEHPGLVRLANQVFENSIFATKKCKKIEESSFEKLIKKEYDIINQYLNGATALIINPEKEQNYQPLIYMYRKKNPNGMLIEINDETGIVELSESLNNLGKILLEQSRMTSIIN